ncbi:molybdopterin-dependent oxidoreductase [Halopenitus sp. H-Gu1]|uniref:molybdopterin-dependent oxidoreductase n=1 Tax=Halopenitus sp. H-Gu1 TaxID=3242697 RepID=UPI00359DD466
MTGPSAEADRSESKSAPIVNGSGSKRSEPSGRQRASRGLAVGAAWIAGLFAVEPLVGQFVPVAVAEGIIIRSPGWLSTLAVSLLGFGAKPVLVGGVLVALLLASAIARLVWPHLPFGTSAAVTIGAGVTAVFFLAVGTGVSVGFFPAVAVTIALPSLVALAFRRVPNSSDRRRFLRRLGSVGVLGTASVAGLRWLFARLAGGSDRFTGGSESERVREPLARPTSLPAGDPAFDFDGMPAAVTSPADHYVIDINVDPPTIDPETWALDIVGAVERSYSLSYDELLEHDAAVDRTVTLVCISNPVGGDLIGTGHWTGVPLSELVAAAEPTAEAVDVVTHAADGYSEAIPIERIEREDVMIAYGMGDRTLATEHGFPARLIVPGRYGMKMTKWIDRIEIAPADHEAYWEARNWDEEAIVNTTSYVRGATREGDTVIVGGVAFGGLETGVEEIATVEVSVDGGETWSEAELEPQLDAHAWRRWRHEFEAPNRGEFQVVTRAIRKDGTVQTDEESSPRPSGATGWHHETIAVPERR